MFIMMKRSTKRLLMIVAALILAGVLIWGIKYRFTLPQIRGETLLRYVPSESARENPLTGFVGINDFMGLYSDLQGTEFFNLLTENGYFDLKNHGYILENMTEEAAEKIMGRKSILAFYGSGHDKDFLFISRIKDIRGLREKVFELYGLAEEPAEELDEVNVYRVEDGVYISFEDELFISSDRVEMIERVYELKKEDGRIANINHLYPWVEEKMDLSASGFTFSLRRGDCVISRWIPLQTFIFGEGPQYSDIYVNEGVYSKIYRKADFQPGLTDDLTFSVVPQKAILASAGSLQNISRAYSNLSEKGLFSIIEGAGLDIENEVLDVFGDRYGYALLMPPAGEEISLPGIVLFAQVEDGRALSKLEEAVGSALRTEMSRGEYEGVEYKKAGVPLYLGMKKVLCAAELEYGEKRILVLTNSVSAMEDVIDTSSGRTQSLDESRQWERLYGELPGRNSMISYLDTESFASTVGVVTANLLGERDVAGLIGSDIFSFISPAATAVTYDGDFSVTHTYFPLK